MIRSSLTVLRRVAPVAVLAALAFAPAAAHAGAVPDGTEYKQYWFPSGDGTLLHADVLTPKGATKSPVILSIGPYFAHSGAGLPAYDPNGAGPSERFSDMYKEGDIFKRGYALVLVDLRGFGGSEGCNDFGGVGEQADAKAAVEWAASQPWSTGKVGMWGKSYDGWTEVMGLATKPKGLAAAVIMSPIIDGYRTLYMNGVHYDAGWYGTPGLYQADDLTPPTTADSPEYIQHVLLGTNPACYALNIFEQTALIDRDDPAGFWSSRGLIDRAKGSTVPVFWSHGFLDANTKPNNFLDVYEHLAGPHRAWFGQYDHVRGNEVGNVGKKGFIAEAMRWFDRYVKGVPADQAPVESDPGVEVEDGALQKYRAEGSWPPADVSRFTLPVKDGSIQNERGNNAQGTSPGSSSNGLGNWSISQALPYDIHMAGVPKLALKAATPIGPRANLFAMLYDIAADGKAVLVSRGAYAVTPLNAGDVGFDMYPQDWTFKSGHRVGFLIGPSMDDWFLSPAQLSTVGYSSATLSLPFLRYERLDFLTSKPTAAEGNRPAPFDVASKVAASLVALQLPPQLTTPPSVTLPGTKTKAKKKRLTVRLRRAGARRLVASGKAPSGRRITVRLLSGKRTMAVKRVKSRGGRWSARFRAPKAGRYSVVASLTFGGSSVRVKSARVRVR